MLGQIGGWIVATKTILRTLLLRITLFTVIALSLGCSSWDIHTDFKHDTNFTALKTYAWITNDQIEGVDFNHLAKNALDSAVVETVDEELRSKGFPISAGNPDFLVSYFLVTQSKKDVYTQGNPNLDLGYQSKGSSTRDHQQIRESYYEQGVLIIDIIDAQTRQRLWNSYAQSRIDPSENTEDQVKKIKSAIIKSLKHFPPT